MPVIPGINKDITLITKDFNDKIHEPKHQRNLVLIIVCIALLLDNMLYMVIVPIIPTYLQSLDAEANKLHSTTIPIMQDNTHLIFAYQNETHDQASAVGLNSGEETPTPSPSLDDILSTTKKGKNFRVRGGNKNNLLTTLSLTTSIPTEKKSDSDGSEDIAVGFLFASKAMVQLLVNPFSGHFIDRIGYDIPMCIGLFIIFLSTMTFSFSNSYVFLFLARSMQGVGSAFADTSGLAMIADRFTEEGERSKALGIALAFISFGSLVAPPFGGTLYEYLGRRVPFILLALLALVDGCMLFLVMRPHRIAMTLQQDMAHKPKGTPIWKLLMDPYIAVCAGALVMANVSLAFLEPTIAIWMRTTMNASESQIGFVWLPGFIPHLGGVVFTIYCSKRFPQHQWLLAAGGLALEGFSCFIIPFCTNYIAIMLPISGICFGIALVDTAILPTLGYLVDVRHTSVYGSVYAIADISYSLAYAFGPIMAGNIYHLAGFFALNMGICFSNVLYAPVIYFLRYFYEFKPLESNELSAISNAQGAIAGAGFKRFNNDDNANFDENNYTSIDTSPGMNFNPNNNRGQAPGTMRNQNINKPESAVFQNMEKYPRKQTKNPYKDTHNLIDNMEDEDY